MVCCPIVAQKLTFWGLGGLLVLTGAILGGLWNDIFNLMLKDELVLSETSTSYNMWKETPLPIYMKFYMFNWTNPEDSINLRAKPSFTQHGPYVFREKHTKVNIKWPLNETVTFQQVRSWNYEPSMSSGSLDDKITNINVIAMTIGNFLRKTKLDPIILTAVDAIIKVEEKELYVTKTVRELLFDGYEDPLLSLADSLKKFIKINLPFDKFGWFYNRNNSATYDGVFNMNTGQSTLDKLGLLSNWNYQHQLKYFTGNCGVVRGSTGELWPRSAASQNYAEIFSNDICSTLKLTETERAVFSGLVGTRFIATENLFDNGTLLPDNKCYCVNNECNPSGVREISTCRYNAPAFISLPHFYKADPWYRDRVDGMFPDPDKHSFSISLEHSTGIPLSVNARLQINIKTTPIRGIRFFSRLPRLFMPVMWFDQTAEITPALATQLKALNVVSIAAEPILFTLVAIGVVLILTGLYLLYRGRWTPRSDSSTLLNTSTAS